MKKLLLIIILIPFFITIGAYFIASSFPDHSEDRLPIEDEKIAETLINIVQNYRQDMVNAVNNGGFGDITDYFLAKNQTYGNVRAYMNNLQNSFGTEMELIEQTIEEVSYYNEGHVTIYCVDAIETVRLVKKGEETIENLSVRYELINHDGEYKIESIKENN